MAPLIGMQAHQNVHTRHSLIPTQGAHATAPTHRSTFIRVHHGLNIDIRQLIRLSQTLSLERGPVAGHSAFKRTTTHAAPKSKPNVMQRDMDLLLLPQVKIVGLARTPKGVAGERNPRSAGGVSALE